MVAINNFCVKVDEWLNNHATQATAVLLVVIMVGGIVALLVR